MLCIFAASIGAMKHLGGTGFTRSTAPACVRASDVTEARERAMELAHEEWPTSDGWYDHHANIVQVPQDWVTEEEVE